MVGIFIDILCMVLFNPITYVILFVFGLYGLIKLEGRNKNERK